jgi:hypothetical protein
MLFALASQSREILNKMVKDSDIKHSKKNHLATKNIISSGNTDSLK